MADCCNSGWYPGTAQFHIRFTTASSNPAFNGQVFDDSLTLVVTPNVITQAPLLNADFVYFTGYAGLGSIRVFEESDSPGNSTGSVSFYGKIGSLIPTRFADATGGATIVASIDPNAVSEPSEIVLVALALGALGTVRLRQRRVRDQS